MLKIPRFVKEFANAEKRSLLYNELMTDENKQKGMQSIECAVNNLESGFITLNEAIDIINHPFRV